MGAHNSYMHDVTRRAKPAASLAALRPRSPRPLSASLSASLAKRIDSATEALQFLVREDTHNRDESSIVFDVQFYPYVSSEDAPVAPLRTPATFKQYREAVAQLRLTWRPKYSASPLPRFRQRAVQIGRETDSSKALVKYEGLVNEMEEFEGLVHDAAREHDWAIQQAIDEARGK
jgi:hypothetical protein